MRLSFILPRRTVGAIRCLKANDPTANFCLFLFLTIVTQSAEQSKIISMTIVPGMTIKDGIGNKEADADRVPLVGGHFDQTRVPLRLYFFGGPLRVNYTIRRT